MNRLSSSSLSSDTVIAVAVAAILALAWTLCYYWHQYDGDDVAYLLEFTNHNGVGQGRNSLW